MRIAEYLNFVASTKPKEHLILKFCNEIWNTLKKIFGKIKHDCCSLIVKINKKAGKPLLNVFHKDENKTHVEIIDPSKYISGNNYVISTGLLETSMEVHAELVTKKVSDYFYKRLKNGEEKILFDNLEYYGIPGTKEKEIKITYQLGDWINVKSNGAVLQMTRNNPVKQLTCKMLTGNPLLIPGNCVVTSSKRYLDVSRLFKTRIVKSIPVDGLSDIYINIVQELTNDVYRDIKKELGYIRINDIIFGE